MDNNNPPLKQAFTITINPKVIEMMTSKMLIKQSYKKLKAMLTSNIADCECVMEFTKKGIPHFHGMYCDNDIDPSFFHMLINNITYKNKCNFFGFILVKPAYEPEGWNEYMSKSQETVNKMLAKMNIVQESKFTHKRKPISELINDLKINMNELDKDYNEMYLNLDD